MTSPDMYAFWANARAARARITGVDDAEDFFTREVDLAHTEVGPSASGQPGGPTVERLGSLEQ